MSYDSTTRLQLQHTGREDYDSLFKFSDNNQKARPLQDGRPGRKDSVTDCFDNNATALFGQRTVWTTSAHCLDNVAMHCPLKP